MRFKYKVFLCMLGVTLLFIAASWYFLSQNSVRLVVDNNGNIASEVEKLRSLVQGKKFWEVQLYFVDKELSKPDEILNAINSLDEYESVVNKLREQSENLLSTSNNPSIQAYVSSESYLLKKEAERLQRLSEAAYKREKLELGYKNSIDNQDEYLEIKSSILSKLSRYIN